MSAARCRPLSRFLKDFKMSQTQCAHCGKGLDRTTLVYRQQIINKIDLAGLDTPIDEAAWLKQRDEWLALCRFCGELHCCPPGRYFDVLGFKRYLQTATEMRPTTVREYVVRLRRFDAWLVQCQALDELNGRPFDEALVETFLPEKQAASYRIALRKYCEYLDATPHGDRQSITTSAIY